MAIRGYLRASTVDQDAERARDSLTKFAAEHGACVTTFYTENISGTTLERSELDRLIDESRAGDVLLVEGIDRLTRLSQDDWKTLKHRLASAGILICAKFVPMTHDVLQATQAQRSDWSHDAVKAALRDLMIELAAARRGKTTRCVASGPNRALLRGRPRMLPGETDRPGYGGTPG